jgi:hypothetical protein
MPFQYQSFRGHLVVLPLSDLGSDIFLLGAFQCHEGVHWVDGCPYHAFLDNAARAVELADSTAGVVTRFTLITAKVAIAAPTPIPALAPVDKPCWDVDGVVEARLNGELPAFEAVAGAIKLIVTGRSELS